MPDASVVIFGEDSGHSLVARAILRRLAGDHSIRLDIREGNAQGGAGRAKSELRNYQAIRRSIRRDSPDLLVVLIDGNCQGWSSKKKEISEIVDATVFPRVAIGCPDPHVERWLMADASSFKSLVGVKPPPDPGKCQRGIYKKILSECLLTADFPALGGPLDLAADLFDKVDWSKACKADRSLKDFVGGLNASLTQLKQHDGGKNCL